MARIDGPWIILENGEGEEFRRRIAHPDPDTIRRRDAFFAELDQMDITQHEDGSVSLEFELKEPIGSAMVSTESIPQTITSSSATSRPTREERDGYLGINAASIDVSQNIVLLAA